TVEVHSLALSTAVFANTGDSIIVGMPVAGGGRTLAGIQASLYFRSFDAYSPAGALRSVLIDDSADTNAHPSIALNVFTQYDYSPNVINLAPNPISWQLAPTTPMQILGGSGRNHFQINGTEAGVPLTIVAGTGGDSFDVGNSANQLDDVQG